MQEPSSITRDEAAPSWPSELAHSLCSARQLADAGLLAEQDVPAMDALLARYKLRLPRYYAGLIDRADPDCPIRRQAIPSLAEGTDRPDLVPDPLADLAHQPAPRITHRYEDRALLHLTSNCSMYCRYCFRKSLLNELAADLFGGELRAALEYLGAHPEIREVILSGGDPLLARDAVLDEAIAALSAMPHLKRLRIHTRVPVTFPVRLTAPLARALTRHRLPVVIVTHFNHPREVTPESRAACGRLREAGTTLLNQSVLLRGVNDDADTLAALSEALFTAGILPYYLHHPDRAAGTGHFDVSRERGLALHRALRTRLSGYLVPRYVVDLPGRPYKANVAETVAE